MTALTYAKQYIRHADTYVAGTAAIDAYSVVELTGGLAVPSNGGEVLGIAQHDLPATAADATASRLLTVATSGNLILNCASDAAYQAIAVGSAVTVNAAGLAINTGGVAITYNNTTPIVVDKQKLGGLGQVIVRFQ